MRTESNDFTVSFKALPIFSHHEVQFGDGG